METKISSAQEAYKLGTQNRNKGFVLLRNDENFYISTIYY